MRLIILSAIIASCALSSAACSTETSAEPGDSNDPGATRSSASDAGSSSDERVTRADDDGTENTSAPEDASDEGDPGSETTSEGEPERAAVGGAGGVDGTGGVGGADGTFASDMDAGPWTQSVDAGMGLSGGGGSGGAPGGATGGAGGSAAGSGGVSGSANGGVGTGGVDGDAGSGSGGIAGGPDEMGGTGGEPTAVPSAPINTDIGEVVVIDAAFEPEFSSASANPGFQFVVVTFEVLGQTDDIGFSQLSTLLDGVLADGVHIVDADASMWPFISSVSTGGGPRFELGGVVREDATNQLLFVWPPNGAVDLEPYL